MTITTLLLVLVAATPSGGASDVTVLDFTADWCGPCRQMRPVLERLTEAGMPIKAVDIDRSPKLAQRYSVSAVPTFIAVDAEGKEIDRISGARPGADLERLYRNALGKAGRKATSGAQRRPAPNRDRDSGDEGDEEPSADSDDPDRVATDDSDEDSAPRRFENPKAWETVVRIRVLGNGSIGFGSGTIISSTPEESIILTCAHVFKLDGRRQPPASQFPNKIMIDLFDGQLRGEKPAHVTFAEAVEGKAVDYDFTLDVGLIRIRPGRRLPSARVVPAHWTPKENYHMLTVGCSEGRDASVWATKILKPKMKGLSGNPHYEAIECAIAPLQGRSGGGLFTDDGYVAGVCNFAENHGNIGLYATPTSIYKLLDKNKLMALYAPVSSGNARLVAGNGTRPKVRLGTQGRGPDEEAPRLRGQSPERDDDRDESGSDVVMIPSPPMLGIKMPGERKARVARSSPAGATASAGQAGSWQRKASAANSIARPEAVPTDASIDPSVEVDPFERFDEGRSSDPEDEAPRRPAAKARPGATKPGDQLNWRPVKSATP